MHQWSVLTGIQVDMVGEHKICSCLCVGSRQVELAEVGHVEDGCALPTADTLGLDLTQAAPSSVPVCDSFT